MAAVEQQQGITFPRACVLLICGLPGSGKSTLARVIEKHGHILEAALSRHLIQMKGATQKPSDFIVKRVSYDAHLHSALQSHQGIFTPEIWHDSRTQARQEIKDLLEAHQAMPSGDPNGSITHHFLALVVDDTMHYRSMRHSLVQTCIQHSASFVQISVNAPIETCMQRNEARFGVNKINPQIIERMVFEEPGSSTHWWDVNCASIDNSQTKTEEELVVLVPWEKIAKFSSIEVQSPEQFNTRAEASETLNEKSLLQEFDLRSRKEIGAVMASKEMRQWSKALSAFKQHYLARLRVEITEEMKKRRGEEFDRVLEDLVKNFRQEMESFLLGSFSAASSKEVSAQTSNIAPTGEQTI